MMTYSELDTWGETYNLGYGDNWSIQELADIISDNQVHLDGRPGEMRETLADITKIESNCNWKPKVNIIDWIKSQL